MKYAALWDRFIAEIYESFLEDKTKTFSAIQKNAIIAFAYDTEVNSGGHITFFDSFGDVFSIDEVAEALRATGGEKFAAIFLSAAAHIHDTEEYGYMPDNPSDSDPIEDDDYYEMTPTLPELLEQYIFDHKEGMFIMRKITQNELEQIADQMLSIFFDEVDVSMVTQGIETDTAKIIIRENLYRDMEYFYRYGHVFVADDDMSGIVAFIDGKKFSFWKKTMLSLKSNKIITKATTKEELKLLNSNAKKVQEVHSFNWYKKRNPVPYYLAHIGIDKSKRGQGICREMMEFVFDYTRKYNSELVLETFSDKNASIYKHFGFEVVEIVESKDKSIKQYRMLKKL